MMWNVTGESHNRPRAARHRAYAHPSARPSWAEAPPWDESTSWAAAPPESPAPPLGPFESAFQSFEPREPEPPARPASRRAPVQMPDGRGEGIQALTREVLIRRSLEVSPSGFITIISIIQGVALALLAQNTFPKPSVLTVLQSLTLMLVFVAVFYFYLTMSILLRWAPSFVDCFLPFAIAGLEIPPAFFVGDVVAWNAWLATFWFCTLGGLWITTRYSPQSHFGNDAAAHRLLHNLLRELRLAAGLGGCGAGLSGLVAYYFPAAGTVCGFAGTAAVLAAFGLVVARTELRASQIHERYGVNRPPFN